jgi:hypothetical protein
LSRDRSSVRSDFDAFSKDWSDLLYFGGMLAPDLSQTAAFLGCLTGDNGWTTPVTWQVLDDAGARRGLPILHGPLYKFGSTLRVHNEQGAGIFVMVNAGDGRARRTSNVIALRALFVDEDAAPTREIALTPSCVVHSARGRHLYWCLVPDEPVTQFTAAQKQLAAYYGTDPAVSDLPRLMRVPGFFHRKREPTAISVEVLDARRRFTIAEILAAHPQRRRRTNQRRAPAAVLPTDALGAVQHYVAWAARHPHHEGVRNTTAFSLAAEGFRRGIDRAVVVAVVENYCAQAGIAGEAAAILRSAEQYAARRGDFDRVHAPIDATR